MMGSNTQEQQFLENQKNRLSDRHVSSRKATDDLYAFWTILRQRLADWDHRLDQLKATQPTTIRQDLQNLCQELVQMQKHCLASASVAESIYSYDEWQVPEDLPVADLRLLHAEFTKYMQKFETVKQQLIPKGKFIFEQYRQAIAKRNAQGMAVTTKQTSLSSLPSSSTFSQASHSPIQQGGILESISNASVFIDANGTVKIVPNIHSDDPANGILPPNTPSISASSLLVRNLKDCTVKM